MILRNRTEKSSLECEVADSPWKQTVGLSFSAKRRSMLFFFPFQRKWEFWMFGMSYPLWIVFIDSGKRVVEVQNAEPLSFNPRTWKVYVSRIPYKYVLEVPVNSKYKFREGDKLEW